MKFFLKKVNKLNRGYTIIETMIAISIFLVVIMIGMDTLLNANLVHRKSQDMRSIIDNLSFIMEDMSRNLRTGYNYHCGDFSNIESPQSCVSDNIIFFEESSNGESGDVSDQWGYKIDLATNGTDYSIYKSIEGGAVGTWIPLNIEEEVKIDPNASSFSVIGAEPQPDTQQPFVTIRLVGTITYRNIDTPFSLQTSVSQRLVDIVI